MRKLPHAWVCTALLVIYVLTSVFALLIIVSVWGIRISDRVLVLILLLWASFCYSGIYWQPMLTIANMQVRCPTIAEEMLVKKLIGQVQDACEIKKGARVHGIEILIEEAFHLNGFAFGRSTLILSRGAIEQFDEAELLGVIAHELGHLYHRDAMVNAVFSTACRLHHWYPRLRRECRKLYWISRFSPSPGLVLLLLVLALLLLKPYLFIAVALLVCYLFGAMYFDQLFLWLWITNYRFIEYERDFFAYELGFGEGLCSALLKLSKEKQPVSWNQVIKSHTHPVTQHRIRRLEILNGSSHRIS